MMEESFVQAAGRHLKDAEYLLNGQRWDNSVYLAGYVVECTFKSIVEAYLDRTTAIKYGHDLTSLQGTAMNRLRVLYPATDTRIPSSRTEGTILEKLHPQRRYGKNGLWNPQEAKEAVKRAREIYEEVIPSLILDGRISIEEL